MGQAVATLPSPERGPRPRYSIAPTERGWLLVIQDAECSVMQVFRTSAAARCAVDRMMAFFDTMRAQAPATRELALY
jgi:hypothetical protein